MNEELTNEVLEAMVNCDGECIGCLAQSVCDAVGIKRSLATALLEERAKPKVWDGAPEDATVAEVTFQRDCGELLENLSYETYNREPPKTRARQIAENIVHGINGGATGKDIEYVEGVLKRYAEELEGKE
jgi:predicted metal-dependent RNase